ncbi:VrrA/YqfQ family protein [Oceanobacillus senegalensis]|uniref:VrrA/YqfQ family protein n=1 Tax=Oceanobacillus senegalensis TaxID=1936063 RepID=UPI000A3092CB|nr:VrrA/YqfQ family protein [Oceanobacillus senegalensis]
MLFPTQRPHERYPMRQNNFMMPQQSQRVRNNPYYRNGGQRSGHQGFLQKMIGMQPNITEAASKGVGGLSKTLTNVQQVLNVVQSTAPIIQEYGPMVKNLPAMYRMMKAFKDIEKMDDHSNETDSQETTTKDDSFESEKSNQSDHNPTEGNKKRSSGQSQPKLYI